MCTICTTAREFWLYLYPSDNGITSQSSHHYDEEKSDLFYCLQLEGKYLVETLLDRKVCKTPERL